jgi:hypothetical protein
LRLNFTPELTWKLGDQNFGIEITTEDIDLIIREFNVRILYLTRNTDVQHTVFDLFSSDIEAECQDDYMKIRIGFNGSFNGLLYSAGKL